jgi:hypothetical protein
MGDRTNARMRQAGQPRPTSPSPLRPGSVAPSSTRVLFPFCTWTPLIASFWRRHPRIQDRGSSRMKSGWRIGWQLERGEWIGAGKILLKEPGLYPRQIPATHKRWIESHTTRQDNKVMEQPQVLGTIPWSTRGSTKERREEPNQRTKLPDAGGLSRQEGRTVRTGHRTVRPRDADSPQRCCGHSAKVPRTVRPGTADSPLKPTEPPETNREKRTVREDQADCPRELRTSR